MAKRKMDENERKRREMVRAKSMRDEAEMKRLRCFVPVASQIGRWNTNKGVK